MNNFLVIMQQMPGQWQPQQQPQPAQQPYPQPVQQQMPQQGAMPSGNVSMANLAQWAAIGGAASGALQAVLGIINGFDPVGMAITVVAAAVIGVLAGVLLGQFGSKIPVQGTVMVKGALFMFVLNFAAGFLLGFGEGFLSLILGMAGIGAGAFIYGFILQKKVPNLI